MIKSGLGQVNLESGDGFSSCCGARYKKYKSRMPSCMGITLLEGKVGRAGDNKTTSTYHVDTQNGPITINLIKA